MQLFKPTYVSGREVLTTVVQHLLEP